MSDNDSKLNELNEKLKNSANFELTYQYSIWKKDYKSAYTAASLIVSCLNAPSLSGYKSYWNYILGTIAFYLYKSGELEYKSFGTQAFSDALKGNINIRWLAKLSSNIFNEEIVEFEDDFFEDIIMQIENNFSKFKSSSSLEKTIKRIIDNLQSNGKKFEQGHQELGELLGYNSINPLNSGAPDPYWIINSDLCVVSEDKIYESDDKIISISDVSEASRHKIWIQSNEKQLNKEAEIITVFITNASKIDEDATIYCDDIYYIEKRRLINWAIDSTNVLRRYYSTFVDIGESNWRNSLHEALKENNLTPKDFIELVKHKKLGDL